MKHLCTIKENNLSSIFYEPLRKLKLDELKHSPFIANRFNRYDVDNILYFKFKTVVAHEQSGINPATTRIIRPSFLVFNLMPSYIGMYCPLVLSDAVHPNISRDVFGVTFLDKEYRQCCIGHKMVSLISKSLGNELLISDYVHQFITSYNFSNPYTEAARFKNYRKKCLFCAKRLLRINDLISPTFPLCPSCGTWKEVKIFANKGILLQKTTLSHLAEFYRNVLPTDITYNEEEGIYSCILSPDDHVCDDDDDDDCESEETW